MYMATNFDPHSKRAPTNAMVHTSKHRLESHGGTCDTLLLHPQSPSSSTTENASFHVESSGAVTQPTVPTLIPIQTCVHHVTVPICMYVGVYVYITTCHHF